MHDERVLNEVDATLFVGHEPIVRINGIMQVTDLSVDLLDDEELHVVLRNVIHRLFEDFCVVRSLKPTQRSYKPCQFED